MIGLRARSVIVGRWMLCVSVFGQGGEVSFGGLVPAHPQDGVLPAALHLFEGVTVGLVATRDHLVEVAVL